MASGGALSGHGTCSASALALAVGPGPARTAAARQAVFSAAGAMSHMPPVGTPHRCQQQAKQQQMLQQQQQRHSGRNTQPLSTRICLQAERLVSFNIHPHGLLATRTRLPPDPEALTSFNGSRRQPLITKVYLQAEAVMRFHSYLRQPMIISICRQVEAVMNFSGCPRRIKRRK